MKLKFNLKKKEASLEADAEKLIEKKMEYNQKNLENKVARKTRYQIRQEEKRKNKELEHKHLMHGMFFLLGIGILGMVIAVIGSFLSNN